MAEMGVGNEYTHVAAYAHDMGSTDSGHCELIWAGVHNAVPHDDLCATNPCNHKISVPEDRKFFLRGKRWQAQKASSKRGAKSNWNLVV